MRLAVAEPVGRFFSGLSLIYYSIPLAQVEVLLPPLGSWKRRLLGEVGSQRHTSSQRAASAS
jgi:hypothetical protein